MDYSFFALNSFFFSSMYQGVPYIDFQRGNERSDPSDLKAYHFSHRIHAYRYKSCVYHFSHVFRDDQGNIKGQKMAHGV